MWNTIWHFTAVLLFRKPSSPSPKLPLTHSFPLAISFSDTNNKIDATQYLICKTVQHMSNRVIHSKETDIVFKMTMFCVEEVTKHISSSQRRKWKKVIKITHQYVPWQCFHSLINVTYFVVPVHIMEENGREELQLHTLLTLYSCTLSPRGHTPHGGTAG